jgi:hypothetical protein
VEHGALQYCGADNFLNVENEMAPHKILFRAVAFSAICDMALCATSLS